MHNPDEKPTAHTEDRQSVERVRQHWGHRWSEMVSAIAGLMFGPKVWFQRFFMALLATVSHKTLTNASLPQPLREWESGVERTDKYVMRCHDYHHWHTSKAGLPLFAIQASIWSLTDPDSHKVTSFQLITVTNSPVRHQICWSALRVRHCWQTCKSVISYS